MNALTSFMSKTWTRGKYKLAKNAPTIAIVTGIVGMGATAYLTYKATTKIEAAKAERDNNYKLVEGYLEAGCICDENGKVTDIYSHEDAERDRRIYKSRFLVTCAKYLALPAFTFIVSGGLIGYGTKKLIERLALAGATIAGLTAQLADVKKELDEAVGKEKADDIFLGRHTTTESEITEDGEIITTEKTTTNRFVTGYTFEFSKASSPSLYSGNYSRDKNFIEGNMRHANWLMNEKKGFVTLNDILDDFDVPMDGIGYGQTDGSVETPGHTIIFDVVEKTNPDGTIYFSITPNLQGYICDKI